MRVYRLGTLMLVAALLTACGLATPQPTATPTLPPPLSPEQVRDAAVQFVVEGISGLKAPKGWITIEAAGGLLGVTALRFEGEGWTVDVQAPVVPRPDYVVRVVHESGARWEGKVLAEGSVVMEEVGPFVADDTSVTLILGAVQDNPQEWAGKYIRVVGHYEGWDLFGSVGSAPPVTKSDWVLRDASGAIYVAAGSGNVFALDISPSQRVENVLLRLFAEVRVTDAGQPYLWLLHGMRIGPIGDAFVEYERMGGIAGFQDRLRVYPSGRAEVQRGEQQFDYQLWQEQLDTLKQTFKSADFFSLDPEYLPKNTCCDRFTYTVHYRDPETGKVHSVYAMDGTVPSALEPVLDALNALLIPPK